MNQQPPQATAPRMNLSFHLRQIQDEMAENLAQCETYEEEMRRLNERLERKEQEIHQNRAAYDTLHTEYASLLGELEQRIEAATAATRADLVVSQRNAEDRDRRLQASQREISALMASFESERNAIRESFQSEMVRLAAKLEDETRISTELIQENKTMQSSLSNMKAIQSEKDSLASRLQNLTKTLGQRDKDLEDYETVKLRNKEFEAVMDGLKKEKTSLSKKLEELKVANRTLEGKIEKNKLESEEESKRSTIKILEQDNQLMRLTDLFATKEEKLVEYGKLLTMYKEKIRKLQNEFFAAQAAYEQHMETVGAKIDTSTELVREYKHITIELRFLIRALRASLDTARCTACCYQNELVSVIQLSDEFIDSIDGATREELLEWIKTDMKQKHCMLEGVRKHIDTFHHIPISSTEILQESDLAYRSGGVGAGASDKA